MKTAAPVLSVVIPTYNRADYLGHCLESLANQSILKDLFEVVVIDDGSQDNTSEVCARFLPRLSLKYYRQKNSGTSAAKNLGIFAAAGKILLFFDDDDIAHEDLLFNHLKAHEKWSQEDTAILGYTTWFPGMPVTPLMHYLTEIGCFLFSYPNLAADQPLDFTYFWCGRISCKRSLLVRHGIFNQDLRSLEDIELGYRLSKFGLKIVYRPACISYMKRPITYDIFCRRCDNYGLAQYLFSRLHPDPLVQHYCQAEDAELKLGSIEPHICRHMSRVRDLESILPPDGRPDQDGRGDPLLEELFALYGWTFNAIKTIAFVEAKQSHEKENRQSAFQNDGKLRGRVLFIDERTPTPDQDSGSQDIYQFMRIFSSLCFKVTFAPANLLYVEAYTPELQKYGIECIHKPDFNSVEEFLECKGYRFDLVMIYRAPVASRYIGALRRLAPQARIVFDTVDLHFLRIEREAELLGSPERREEARKLRDVELDAISMADRTIILSRVEEKLVRDLVPGAKLDLIPIGRPIPGCLAPFDSRNHILFIGGFWHTPNVDAVCWFAKEIWPLIAPRLPGSKLFVVGSNVNEEVSALASDNTVILGYLNDITDVFTNCRLTVAPLRYGAGIKGKIVTSLSYGVPCVATSTACEGMGLISGKHVLTADEPISFADAVVRLHSDRELWSSLSDAGLDFARGNFSIEKITSSLVNMLQEMGIRTETYPEGALWQRSAAVQGLYRANGAFCSASSASLPRSGPTGTSKGASRPSSPPTP